jgi:hypothetical protein
MVGSSYSVMGAARVQVAQQQLPRPGRGTDHAYRPARTSPALGAGGRLNVPRESQAGEHDGLSLRRIGVPLC